MKWNILVRIVSVGLRAQHPELRDGFARPNARHELQRVLRQSLLL